MGLINVTRKAETLQAFQLVTQTDMLTALTYLKDLGYTGSVRYESGTWTFTFQSADRSIGQSAGINDWIVIANNIHASAVSAADAPVLYQPA